jgi:hypothetical protein
MEIVLARYEKDKKTLQDQLSCVPLSLGRNVTDEDYSGQGHQMAQLQGEISRLTTQMNAPRDLPEEIASTIRQDAQVMQTKLQDARRRIDALEADKLEVSPFYGCVGYG